MTLILQAENWQKSLRIFNRYTSVSTDINEKWFVIFEHIIDHFFFGYVQLPQLESFVHLP